MLTSYLDDMKEISIKIDDELYHSVSRKVGNLEAEVNRQVTKYLEAINGDSENIAAARSRMTDLFRSTKAFGVGEKPTREEMHERGSIH